MRHDQVAPVVSRARYRASEEDAAGPRSRLAGVLIRLFLGVIIAVDAALLAAPLYYGMVSPCNMVALSRTSLHAQAVDEEIAITDEISRDAFYASAYSVRSQQGFASCAGEIGGRTLSALLP